MKLLVGAIASVTSRVAAGAISTAPTKETWKPEELNYRGKFLKAPEGEKLKEHKDTK